MLKYTKFQGLVYKIEIEVIGLVAYLTLKGIFYSYLLDITVRKRSFQDTSITYEAVVKSVLSGYSKLAFLSIGFLCPEIKRNIIHF